MYSNLNDNCDASVRSRQEMLSYCEENHLSAPSWLAFKSTTAFYKHTNRTWIVFARIYTVCCLLAAYTLAAWTLLVFSYSRLCIVQHTHTACDSLCLVCSVYKWRDVSKNRTLPSKTTIQTKNNQRNNSSEKGRKTQHIIYMSHLGSCSFAITHSLSTTLSVLTLFLFFLALIVDTPRRVSAFSVMVSILCLLVFRLVSCVASWIVYVLMVVAAIFCMCICYTKVFVLALRCFSGLFLCVFFAFNQLFHWFYSYPSNLFHIKPPSIITGCFRCMSMLFRAQSTDFLTDFSHQINRYNVNILDHARVFACVKHVFVCCCCRFNHCISNHRICLRCDLPEIGDSDGRFNQLSWINCSLLSWNDFFSRRIVKMQSFFVFPIINQHHIAYNWK